MKSILRTLGIILTLFFFSSAYAQTDSTATFKVAGACGMCKQRIEKALRLKGIASAKWDVSTQMLAVVYDASVIRLDDIHNKVAEVGHDTELKKAKDEVYKALPECCLYRELQNQNDSDEMAAPNEHNLNGIVLTEDNKGNFSPLVGASVQWLHSGKTAKSDKHGVFSIPHDEMGDKLIVSYVGYKADTLTITSMKDLQIVLAGNGQLNSVVISSKQRTTYINQYNAFRITTITSKELLKAACCNLSESFETNPSVDVTYNDAVTGSKQIQLLGLSGNYTQLTVENLPGPRGIATPLGLNSIAGPWIESMQLSKGTGSVVNGFESIAGQINVELKKPENSEKLYLNGYVNSMGRSDINLNWSQKIGSKWSTALLLHDDFLYNKVDDNKDGFRDLPTGNLFSAVNRWKYDNGNGLMIQFGAKALIDRKIGGQLAYTEKDKLTTTNYGIGINTDRYEAFAKIGYVFPQKKYRSIGLQLSAFRHTQDAYFGLRTYDADQDNLYANLIYQDIIGNTAHKYRTGLSFSADKYNEVFQSQNFRRNEVVPGAFFEYTFTPNDKFNIVAGLRADYNNLFGAFVTPRINARYELVQGTVIRVSVGRGQRTANIFAENMGSMVSARNFQVVSVNTNNAYGLNPEVAWNKGISVDQKLTLFGKDANLSVDFFRNDFTNQVVVDMEDPHAIRFYNLNGKSNSNSLQAELSLVPVKNLDVRVAYRWFDVHTTYGSKLLQRPLTAVHRAFANLGYELKGWKVDYTANLVSTKRIPAMAGTMTDHQVANNQSPQYVTMNAQLSKTFGKEKAWDWYIGAENLGNYMQMKPIMGADQPFGPHFDASLVWGPIIGRMLYTGFRFKMK